MRKFGARRWRGKSGGHHDTAYLFVKGDVRPHKPSGRPFREVMASLDPATAAAVLKVLLAHTSLRSGKRMH